MSSYKYKNFKLIKFVFVLNLINCRLETYFILTADAINQYLTDSEKD